MSVKSLIDRIVPKPEWFSSSTISYEDEAPLPEEEASKPVIKTEINQQWEALLRGQILSVTTQKLFNYINVCDQKAQMIIILNSIMIPLAISEIKDPDFKIGATIAIITGIASILLSIICIYPKRRKGRKPDGTINHLHFADIGSLKEHDYMASFQPIYNNKTKLTEEVIKDLHDVSRRILLPKFRWLKLAYITFFTGNLVAILYTLAHSWFHAI